MLWKCWTFQKGQECKNERAEPGECSSDAQWVTQGSLKRLRALSSSPFAFSVSSSLLLFPWLFSFFFFLYHQKIPDVILKEGDFLAVWWLRIRLAMQDMVQSLVREDPQLQSN